MDSTQRELWDMAAESAELHNSALKHLMAWNERLEARIESMEERLMEAERRIKLEQQWRNDKFGWRYD